MRLFGFKVGNRAALIVISSMVIAAMLWVISPLTTATADTGSNWTGQYWNNTTFNGNPTLTRTDSAINFNWAGGSPDASLPAGNFSVKWTLTWNFSGGMYTFRAGANGGIRAFIDSTLIINQLHSTSSFTTYTATVNLAAGNHAMEVDYE